MLSLYCDKPWMFYDLYVAKKEPSKNKIADAAHYSIGDMVHAFVLEPERFADEVIEIPSSVLGKNGSKSTNAWKDFERKNRGKRLAKPSELEAVFAAGKRVREAARQYLSTPGYVELSIYYDCLFSGMACKARPDKFFSNGVVWDLKTTDNLDQKRRVFKQCKYWLQEAHYRPAIEDLLGFPVVDFVFGFVEVNYPYRYCEVRLDQSSRDHAARYRIDRVIELSERYQTGNWQEFVCEPDTLSFRSSEIT